MIDSNNVVITYLKNLGYSPKTDYYSDIDYWLAWFKNYVSSFHKYQDHNGATRELFKLGMAKKACEDWASILYTERDEIICNNPKNQEYIDKIFKNKHFEIMLPRNIEKAFSGGTCGTTIRFKNVIVKNNNIYADDKSDFDIINVTADCIVPLLVENGKIINVAFVDKIVKKNKEVFYVEIHEKEENNYKISNVFLDENGEIIKYDNVIDFYYTQSNIPLFNLLTPNLENNIDRNNGLGLSIYSNAIDQLKMCDYAFNNYVKDTVLGGKKVLYDKSLVKYQTITIQKSDGNEEIKEIPIFPDDTTQQLFQEVGDAFENSGNAEQRLIQEYNPDLRTSANEENINYALILFGFKCGMGKYFRFENGTVVTATQYLGENKDLVNSAKKHRANFNNYLVGVVRSILLVGRLVFGEQVDETDEITLTDKDGFLVSDEELKNQWRQDFNMGLMSKKQYLMKARGLTEQEAIETLQEIEEETPTTESILGGGNDE